MCTNLERLLAAQSPTGAFILDHRPAKERRKEDKPTEERPKWLAPPNFAAAEQYRAHALKIAMDCGGRLAFSQEAELASASLEVAITRLSAFWPRGGLSLLPQGSGLKTTLKVGSATGNSRRLYHHLQRWELVEIPCLAAHWFGVELPNNVCLRSSGRARGCPELVQNL